MHAAARGACIGTLVCMHQTNRARVIGTGILGIAYDWTTGSTLVAQPTPWIASQGRVYPVSTLRCLESTGRTPLKHRLYWVMSAILEAHRVFFWVMSSILHSRSDRPKCLLLLLLMEFTFSLVEIHAGASSHPRPVPTQVFSSNGQKLTEE